MKFEELDFTSDSMNPVCDAYDEKLLRDDLVVFDFKLPGSASLGRI